MTEKQSPKSNKDKVFIFKDNDVTSHTDNKNGAKYLNWAYVVATLKSVDPKSTYSVKKYPEINLKTGQLTQRKVDYCEGVNGEGAYVTVTVTFRNKSHTESLPVYEPVPEMTVNSNGQRVYVQKTDRYTHKRYTPHIMMARSIPNSMTINKAIKRCYVKAAAMLTGLGIGLYIDGNSKGVDNDSNSSNSTRRGNFNGNRNNGRQPHTASKKQVDDISRMSHYKVADKSMPKYSAALNFIQNNGVQSTITNYANYLNSSQAKAAYKIDQALRKLPNKSKSKKPSKKQPIGSTGKAQQGSLLDKTNGNSNKGNPVNTSNGVN